MTDQQHRQEGKGKSDDQGLDLVRGNGLKWQVYKLGCVALRIKEVHPDGVFEKAAARDETEECGRSVAEIIHNVRRSGDRALLEYNTRYDGNDRTELRVTREEIDSAYAQMTERELSDLRQAAQNIRAFAQASGTASKGWTASHP